MKKNKAETEKTIRKLLKIAQNHFTDKGYANTSLEEIVHEAELTRGAVYHHFRNKKGLFYKVLDNVQKEIADRIEKDASQSDDVWKQLEYGCRAFITSAVQSQNVQILLIDGPAVLGLENWRLLDEQNSMRLLREQLEFMKEQGHLKEVSIDAMVHSLSGAMNEAVLWIAKEPNNEQLIEETMVIIELMLKGFSKENIDFE
ncbi:TetR/AcrR family transcriptional regulator [Evansella halocellulosilytica]|uniref:TetR/AcrR family transcriptional regulator n=1 Tax=Evansella halocellulosilytica TaxID=2011013 RepID=UPI000BB8D899|nr:TetR/AcrR family transcriptional regulator [Evansella halocellulosilytica]